jgi:hypothetical protein
MFIQFTQLLKVTIYSNQLISPLAIARNTLQEALLGIVKTCKGA